MVSDINTGGRTINAQLAIHGFVYDFHFYIDEVHGDVFFLFLSKYQWNQEHMKGSVHLEFIEK